MNKPKYNIGEEVNYFKFGLSGIRGLVIDIFQKSSKNTYDPIEDEYFYSSELVYKICLYLPDRRYKLVTLKEEDLLPFPVKDLESEE